MEWTDGHSLRSSPPNENHRVRVRVRVRIRVRVRHRWEVNFSGSAKILYIMWRCGGGYRAQSHKI